MALSTPSERAAWEAWWTSVLLWQGRHREARTAAREERAATVSVAPVATGQPIAPVGRTCCVCETAIDPGEKVITGPGKIAHLQCARAARMQREAAT